MYYILLTFLFWFTLVLCYNLYLKLLHNYYKSLYDKIGELEIKLIEFENKIEELNYGSNN